MNKTKEKPMEAPRRREARSDTQRELKEPSFTKKMQKKFRVFSVRSGMDMPFLFLTLTLLIIGLVMLFSASYANAYYRHGSSYFFISKQAIFAVLGVTAMIFISYFDYHHLHKFAIPILLFSYMALVLVLFVKGTAGVHRWIELGPLGQFQPSELAKFAIILVFAHLISINFKRMDTFRYGVLPYVLIMGSMAGLLVLEPHISATVIIVLLAFVMLFIGGVRLRWFGVALGGAGAAVAYLVLFSKKFNYANDRIVAWLDPFSNATKQLIEDTWQTRQSLYAIGSGGLLGLGLGQSRRLYFRDRLRRTWLHRGADYYYFVRHACVAGHYYFAESKG